MSAIRLQFSSRKDLASAAIEFYEHGGLWSHVDAILTDGTLLGARSDVIGNIPPGVQIRPANYYNFSREQIVEIPAAPEIVTGFYNFCHSQIGKPYDEKAILAFAFDRNWRNPDAWFCSELIASALEKSNCLKSPLAAPSNRITPGDLYLVTSVITDVRIPW